MPFLNQMIEDHTEGVMTAAGPATFVCVDKKGTLELVAPDGSIAATIKHRECGWRVYDREGKTDWEHSWFQYLSLAKQHALDGLAKEQ